MLITDNYILEKCSKKSGGFNPNSLRDDNVKKYLELRYEDIPKDLFSYKEVYFRIKHNIEERPVCLICGTPVKFMGYFYGKYCSVKCTNFANKEKMKITWEHRSETDILDIKRKSRETCLLKYGVEYSFLSENNKVKSDITRERKYGDKNYGKFGSDSFKDKMKIKYGYEYPLSNDEVRDKISKALQSDISLDKMKKTCLEKYGVEYVSLVKQFKDKVNETYKEHHSYKTSKQEDMFYELLIMKYDNVERFYSSEEYPFNCDFYILELLLYIECNFHLTHYIHHYDEETDKDIELNLLDTGKFDILKIWRDKDPVKLQTARNNKLNYLVIYPGFHKEWRKLCYYIRNLERLKNTKNLISDFLYNIIENNFRNKQNIQIIIEQL